MSENVKITVKRTTYYPDRLRSYKIFVDKKEIGSIKSGETFTASINPGDHRIYLKIDWCQSNSIKFSAQPESEVNFLCGSNIRGWQIIFAVIYITFLKNQYLWIRKEE